MLIGVVVKWIGLATSTHGKFRWKLLLILFIYVVLFYRYMQGCRNVTVMASRPLMTHPIELGIFLLVERLLVWVGCIWHNDLCREKKRCGQHIFSLWREISRILFSMYKTLIRTQPICIWMHVGIRCLESLFNLGDS